MLGLANNKCIDVIRGGVGSAETVFQLLRDSERADEAGEAS
jgi:hypothetical protein